MVLEEGTKVEGEWVEVSKYKAMEEETTYELQFSIRSIIPLPDWGWVEFLDDLRKRIAGYLIQTYYEKFKGLEIVWWKLTDDNFNIQLRQRPAEETPTTGLAIVVLPIIKLVVDVTIITLAIIAIWAFFESAKKLVKIIPTPPKEAWPVTTVLFLGGLFILGYIMVKPKKEG